MKSSLLLIALALIGCNDKKSPDKAQANTDLAKKTFDAFNHHDWKSMASYYSDTAYFLDPSLGKDYVPQTRQQSILKYTRLQNFAPDIYDSIVGIHASGDKVTVEFVSSGTSNGQKWRLPICSILTIKDGKVIRDATYYDR